MDTINIRRVKIRTPEPISPTTEGEGGERGDYVTTTTTRYRTIIYLVSIRVFETPARDPLNDEAFRVVVAQPMAETP